MDTLLDSLVPNGFLLAPYRNLKKEPWGVGG